MFWLGVLFSKTSQTSTAAICARRLSKTAEKSKQRSKMRHWLQLLWLLTALVSGTALSFGADSSANVRFFGRMGLGVGTDEELSFTVTHDPSSDADHVSIELRAHEAQLQVLNRDAEIGQEFVSNAYFYQLPNGMPIVCVEWALGARSTGLTIYGVDSEKHIAKFFDDSCEYGFQFVNLDSRQTTNLVAVDRLGKSDEYQARVFAFSSGSARFEEIRKEKTQAPHQYRLVTRMTRSK
jgi:hypothetical protein